MDRLRASVQIPPQELQSLQPVSLTEKKLHKAEKEGKREKGVGEGEREREREKREGVRKRI